MATQENVVPQANGHPATRPLTDDEWDTLIRKIADGACTPFLGAGINGGLLPLGGELAQRWATTYSYPLEDHSNLPSVAQYLALTKPERVFPKEEIARLLQSTQAPIFPSTHPLAVLASLPLPVYITTNYDDFLFRALRQSGRDPKVEMCGWNPMLRGRCSVNYDEPTGPGAAPARVRGFGPSRFASRTFMPYEQAPVVFHLHGHQSSLDSMVLTENDYLDFLVNMSRDPHLLPSRIKEALTGAALLFLGYSLNDYNFRVLFRGLIHPLAENRRLSVSIQLPRDSRAVAYLDRYFDDFKIRVYWGTADDFISELATRWRRYTNRGG